MGTEQYGQPTDPLNNPGLSAWAGSVHTAVSALQALPPAEEVMAEHLAEPGPHPQYAPASSVPWGEVATWSALPPTGDFPGQQVRVLDGLGLCVAVYSGTGWVVDPVSDTGWQNVAAALLIPAYGSEQNMLRRIGHRVEAIFSLDTSPPPSGGADFYGPPSGWRVRYPLAGYGVVRAYSPTAMTFYGGTAAVPLIRGAGWVSQAATRIAGTWITDNTWPTTAPA